MAEYVQAGSGEAPATGRQAKYAARYMDMFLATKEMDTFAELIARKDAALTDEGLWRQLATWMASHAKLISDQSKGLDAGTALKMLSSLTKAAKKAAPEHALWAASAHNTWYTEVRQHVEKTIWRQEILDGDEDGEELQDIGHELLIELVDGLNKTGSPDELTRAFAMVLTFHCVGRPGEFVYTSLEKMYYDCERETVAVIWSEMKKMSQYKVPLCVGNRKELCPFWAMSGFYLSGAASGVARGADASGAHFMFSKLAKTPDGAQQYINISVKGGMVGVVDNEQLQYFSGKSLRRGGVGHLTGALALRHDLLPAVAMGNWQIPCRITEYFGPQARESKRAIATRSLAGWANPYTKVVPPRLVLNQEFSALTDCFGNLVVHAYGEHWAEFGPDRRLAKVGELLLAVELMYLPDIVADRWGPRHIVYGTLAQMPLRVNALLDKSVAAGLGKGMVRCHVLELLVRQGKLIRTQFLRDNAAQALASAADGPATDAVNALVAQYAELRAENCELRNVRNVFPTHCFSRRLTSPHFASQLAANQMVAMQQLATAMQQLRGDVASLSRGAVIGDTGHSPPRILRKATAAAVAAAAAVGAARVSPPNGLGGLVPSNADGVDDSGYFVPPAYPLANFISDVLTKALGSIKTDDRTIGWHGAQWRTLSEARGEKALIDRNFEAKKITDLFLFVATDDQLRDITAELPTTHRQAAMERRTTAVQAVVAKICDEYLVSHEQWLPQTGAARSNRSGHKLPNCGALYSRWKKVKFVKGRPAGMPVQRDQRVDWLAAGMLLAAPVVHQRVAASGVGEGKSKDKNNRKRKRNNKN